MLGEFKKFVLRGDVVALSTGVIIGGAFGKIVTALTDGLVNPLLALFGGSPEVKLGFKVGDSYFNLGLIISAIIAFLITAAVVFFFIVKPSQALMARLLKEEKAAPPPAPAADVVLLTQIRDLLSKK